MTMVCEWCWAQAYKRELTDTSKSQGEHYLDIISEQDWSPSPECPEVERLRVLNDGKLGPVEAGLLSGGSNG